MSHEKNLFFLPPEDAEFLAGLLWMRYSELLSKIQESETDAPLESIDLAEKAKNLYQRVRKHRTDQK